MADEHCCYRRWRLKDLKGWSEQAARRGREWNTRRPGTREGGPEPHGVSGDRGNGYPTMPVLAAAAMMIQQKHSTNADMPPSGDMFVDLLPA